MSSKIRLSLIVAFSILAFAWVIGSVFAQGGESPGKSAIEWRTDYEAALAEAKKDGKLVVVDFHATWCGPCKMMDRTTFKNEKVVARLAGFVPLKIDVDKQRDVAAKYGITGMPTLAVLNADGSPVGGATGYQDADGFLALLDKTAGARPGTQKTAPEHGILGQQAPPLGVTTWFNLPEGKSSVDVADYRGKVLYLYGFQSWCPGCHKVGFPTLTKLIERYKGDDRVAFVAVQTTFEGFSSNGPEQAKQTAERYKLAIPVGQSGSAKEPSTMMQRYRTGGTPWTVIIAPDGTVKYSDFHITPEAAIEVMDGLIGAAGAKP